MTRKIRKKEEEEEEEGTNVQKKSSKKKNGKTEVVAGSRIKLILRQTGLE